MRLIQVHCGDLCGPHTRCLDCGSLVCRHTLDFLADVADVRTAIAALPTARRHVPYVPRPGSRLLQTCQIPRLPVAMTIGQVGAWTFSARHDHLGVN